MSMRPLLVLAVCAVAFPAFAEDDDDLAPLAPTKKAPPRPPPARKAPPAHAPPPPAKKAPAASGGDDDLAPLAATKGDVLLKLNPPINGAVLAIDGKDVGAMPLPAQTLATGEHNVVVRRLGYANFVKKVIVTQGKTVEVEAKMMPVSAVLSVTSDVADCQVYINGKLIGTTPLSEREWPAGTYELSIRKDGYQEDRQMVTLAVGRDYPVAVKFAAARVAAAPVGGDRPVDTSLTPRTGDAPLAATATASAETPVYTKWFFWAGAGAVVVGVVAGVAVGVANSNQKAREATSADFKPYSPTGSIDGCINVSTCTVGFRPQPMRF